MGFDPLPYAVPLFVVLIVAEMVWAKWQRRGQAYEVRDTAISMMLGLGSVVAGLMSAAPVLVAMDFVHGLSSLQFGWHWWVWPLCFVADDLAYYWQHRAGHRVRWFWASHVNHHSSQHYNLSTALRQTWTGFLALSFVFRLPLMLVGFAPEMVLTCAGLNLIYQFWIHTEAIGRMPRWFEAVMNTPSHHRVHHATNVDYLDRNYAGTFIVWDKLFGTFQSEDRKRPNHYGIVHQLSGFNLITAAFHEWAAIARDLWHAPWRHKLDYVWREPGWSHDGSRETSAMLRARRAGERDE